MNELETPRRRRPRGFALLFAVVAVVASGAIQIACVTPPNPDPRNIDTAPASLRAGLALYEEHEFARAGRQFHDAVETALRNGDRDLAHRATVAECTSWLRARQLREFCSCSKTLSVSQRRTRTTDPRVNTLIAMGAIAEGKSLPSLKTPRTVRSVLRFAVEEER